MEEYIYGDLACLKISLLLPSSLADSLSKYKILRLRYGEGKALLRESGPTISGLLGEIQILQAYSNSLKMANVFYIERNFGENSS